MEGKNKKILAVVPARGGSKGLPKKNIFPLNGKPLIAYTIEASILSGMITKTIVSSDSDEILEVARQYGASAITRPDELSTDHSASEPVITHVIKSLESEGEYYDIVILLQPTSPLRDSEDVKAALDLFLASGAGSLISVYEPAHTPFKAFKLDNYGFLTGLVDNKTPFMRRQDLPKAFMPNGAIYITYTHLFLKSNSLFCDKTIPYVMTEAQSTDIDNASDIMRCEMILKHHS